jgi:hypothetical protein
LHKPHNRNINKQSLAPINQILRNQQVNGSSPFSGSNKTKHLRLVFCYFVQSISPYFDIRFAEKWHKTVTRNISQCCSEIGIRRAPANEWRLNLGRDGLGWGE